MKPVEFKHQNVVFAEDQPEFQSLPALKINSENGEVISCWKLSFKEKIKILFSGRIWLSMVTYNKPPLPIYLSVNRKEVFSHPTDSDSLIDKIKKLK